MSDKSERLLELARAAFPDLTDPEQKVIQAAASGGVANLQSRDLKENDPATAETWPDERRVRAVVLRWLCVDPAVRRLVDPQGIQVRGARIEGRLDLSFARMPFPLLLSLSGIPEGIFLRESRTASISFEGTHTGPISADRLTVDGTVFLRNGFLAKGLVRLLGARIRGNFDCHGGVFAGTETETPAGKTIVALNADRLDVGGGVFLREGFHATGEVRLLGAHIRGDLDCHGGTFENPGAEALNADGLVVGGNVFLTDEFRARGQVRLVGARIRGNLESRDGTFENPGADALSADGLEARGVLFLRQEFKATGKVSLVYTKARVLADDETSWPGHGDLDLEGFVYEGIVGPTDAARRLRWLGRQYPRKRRRGDYHPQPYEQLAAVLRRAGHVAESKKVLMAKEKDLRKYGDLGFGAQVWNWILGATIGYGYRVRYALGLAAGIVLLGVLFFWLGHRAGLLSPTFSSPAEAAAPSEKRLDEAFCPWMYSLDTFLPIVDLHQEGRWLPNHGGADVATAFWPDRYLFTWGDLLCVWFWIEIGLGWVLTTLALAGLTGLIRRD